METLGCEGDLPTKASRVPARDAFLPAQPLVQIEVKDGRDRRMRNDIVKRMGKALQQMQDAGAEAMGVDEKEVNIRNKLARGKFKAAFLLQCMTAIGTATLHLAG